MIVTLNTLYMMRHHCRACAIAQARKLVQAAEAEDEISGLPLPLLARAAGHWKARTDHRHKDPAPAAVTFDKPLSPLEELMGRGKSNGMNKSASGVILCITDSPR